MLGGWARQRAWCWWCSGSEMRMMFLIPPCKTRCLSDLCLLQRMVLLSHAEGFAPKRQENLPPVVLPQPIDSTVFLTKPYRPPPLAFLKPFGVHVPRLCTPRSDVPTITSVGGGGGHIRGAVEEARLPFDSPRHSPRRAAASHQQATAAPSGASSRAEVRALASRLEVGLARGGSAGALEELWQGVELELVRQATIPTLP